jgi:DNA invertase Pin-like site-specific DNA recombinase
MLTDSRDGKIDVIVCWKLDRLFRSLKDLMNTLQELTDLHVEFVALKDNIDLTTNTGRLLTHILGAFAEFEASIIRSRVNAGLAEAKRKGIKLGRRKTRPCALIQELRKNGYSYRRIADLAGCSISTVWEEIKSNEFGKPQELNSEQKKQKQ